MNLLILLEMKGMMRMRSKRMLNVVALKNYIHVGQQEEIDGGHGPSSCLMAHGSHGSWAGLLKFGARRCRPKELELGAK